MCLPKFDYQPNSRPLLRSVRRNSIQIFDSKRLAAKHNKVATEKVDNGANQQYFRGWNADSEAAAFLLENQKEKEVENHRFCL